MNADQPTSTGQGPAGRPQQGSGTKRVRRRVAWDEDNLAHLEETKTPKQKIEEPKTPYHPLNSEPEGGLSPMNLPSDNEGAGHVDPEQVRTALNEVEAARQRRGGWTSSEDEGDSAEFEKWMEDRAATAATAPSNPGGPPASDFHGSEDYYGSRPRDKAFKEHRKKHYDEFRRLKQLRFQDKKPLDGEAEGEGEDQSEEAKAQELRRNDSEGYIAGAESDGDVKGKKGGALRPRVQFVGMNSDEGNPEEAEGSKQAME